nr:hypothetical protein [Ktedonobacteraceae bacterium]
FTRLFRLVTIAELFVVGLAGIGLFFLPGLAKALWPWHITPFNMLFLGGAYLSSLATIAVMLWGGRWAPARPGLWMLAAFTVPILILSLLHLDRFDFQRWATWVWFLLFFTIAPYSVYTIWRYRHLPPGAPGHVPTLWRSCLLIQGVILGLYGLALLLAPTVSTAFWPWSIDEFHGRVYSAIFLTGATGSLVLLPGAASVELLMLGMTQTVLGLFSLLGLLIGNIFLRPINWSLPGTWIWLGIFAVLFVLGLGLIYIALTTSMFGHKQQQEF